MAFRILSLVPFLFAARRGEREALALDDLASALDAGLMPAQLGGDPALGDGVLADLCRKRQCQLDPIDGEILATSWQAGRAPAALRRMAEQRRQRAVLQRKLGSGLAYPLTLLVLVEIVAVLSHFVLGGSLLPWLSVGLVALLAAVAIAAWRGVRAGDERWLQLPLLGDWARAAAELPYLEILLGLYASGVALRQAHARAVAAPAVGAMRRRLLAADAIVQEGRPLADALAASGAVHHETLTLIATGEQVGELEAALERALARRRFAAESLAASGSKLVGSIAYGIAVVMVLVTVFSFYSGYFAALRHLR